MRVHARFRGAQRVLSEGVRRQRDNGHGLRVRPVHRADLPAGLVSVHLRHHDIHQNVIIRADGRIFKRVHSFFAVGDHRRARPGLFQHQVEDFGVQLVVLCRQNTHVRQIELVPLAGFTGLVYFKRQRPFHGRARAELAVDLDVAARLIDDLFDDGQSEARALAAAAHAAVLLFKRLEHPLLEILAHAEARVRYAEFADHLVRRLIDDLRGQADRAAGLVVFDGVSNHVGKNPVHVSRAGNHARRIKIGQPHRREQNAALRGARLHPVPAVLQQLAQGNGFPLKRRLFGFKLAHIQRVADQAEQLFRRRADLFVIIPNGFGRLRQLVCQVDHAQDAVHRRADVVPHAGQEIVFRLVGHTQLGVLAVHLPRINQREHRRNQQQRRSRDDARRLIGVLADVVPERCRAALHVRFAQVPRFILIGQAVYVVIERLEKRVAAFPRNRHADFLLIAGNGAHRQRAVCGIDVIVQRGTVADGDVRLTVLHRLHAFHRRVVKIDGLKSGQIELFLHVAHCRHGIPLFFHRILGIGQRGIQNRLTAHNAQLRAQRRRKRQSRHNIVFFPRDEQFFLVVSLTESVFGSDAHLLGKVVENGNQHAFRFAVFLVDIRRVVLHAEHFERLHRGDVLFLLLRDRIGVFRPLEILVVELFLKLGLHQINARDRLVQLLDQFRIALRRGEIIRPRGKLLHDARVGNRRKRQAGNHIHLAGHQRLLLFRRAAVKHKLILDAFRFQIMDDLVVSGRRLLPQADAQWLHALDVRLAQAARRRRAQRGIHRAVAVFRKFKRVLRLRSLEHRAEQIHPARPQILDCLPDGLVVIRRGICHILNLPARIFRNLFEIIKIIPRDFARMADEAHALLFQKSHAHHASFRRRTGAEHHEQDKQNDCM